MELMVAFFITPEVAWAFAALTAGWLVLVCLKSIAGDLDHALRWQKLKADTQRLREQQQQRMRDLNRRLREAV